MINPDDFVFDFGQYIGFGYREVLKIDPQYIQWCEENIQWFILSDVELGELEEALRES